MITQQQDSSLAERETVVEIPFVRTSTPSVSIIVPTYKEAENLPGLIERLDQMRREFRLDIELLIMDDNSRDGSEELISRLALPWVRLIVRTKNRGLSPAVLDGLGLATRETVVVMDADLSHPPEKIPDMLAELDRGAEFVIGSRYVAGAATGEDWGLFRWLNSKVATWLARPFTRAADPMSGFFAFRRAALAKADELNPVGYKIGLELLVKCGFRRVVEVPIFFAQRQLGYSKLSFKEQLRYLQHLRRLMNYKYPFTSHALQFGAVGGVGVVVHLAVLTALLWAGLRVELAVLAAIAVAMVSNFALNRRITFSHAQNGSLWRQFAGFVGACSLGALVNYGITMAVLQSFSGIWPQVAALAGIAGGMTFNFLASRYFVFRT
jgi:dolichol-phosphate mannosyltransferase